MLVELLVENYAVVERVRVRFHRGLNLLTGETGSGKSIVVDALGLLFGGRASADIVRSGADRARISGIFEVSVESRLTALLESAGIEIEDGEILIEREILASGKSRAFAGSRPATAGLLKELAPLLGDIHGQHDQQRLFSSEAQLELLDGYAGSGKLLRHVAGLYRDWRAAGAELDDLEANEQERLRLADLWSFQRKEIEDAAPTPGEDAALENERRMLNNVARLEESTNAAYNSLYDSPDAALARIRQASRSLEEAAGFDESLQPILNSLKPAEIVIEEAAHELRHYLGRLEADPSRLEEVEARLDTLDKLKRKYGSTVEEVCRFLDEVKGKLEELESSDERREALRRKRDELAVQYKQAAAELSAKRREAAGRLEKAVRKELESLKMERTTFHIELEQTAWSGSGADRARFLVSPNLGEEPRPMEKTASGGELSRIALALKACTAASSKRAPAAGPRTLVFDEVDAGVGGGAAEAVGRRLKRISAADQVLCVTHLPQIAGFADHHYHVAKAEANGRTVATVAELDSAERVREIGRMLSGQRLTEEALRHAEQLMRVAGD